MEIDNLVKGMASTNIYMESKDGEKHKILAFEFFSETIRLEAYRMGRFVFTENMARQLRDRLTEMLEDTGPEIIAQP